jgi:predicted RND superfamily exporter protein
MNQSPPDLASMAAIEVETDKPVEEAKLPRWDDPDAADSPWRFLDLSSTVNNWLKKDDDQKEEEEPNLDLAQQLGTDKDGNITLAIIEELQSALRDTGWVGKTNALPDVVKVVNREMHTGDDGDYLIPQTVPAVAQLLLQFQSSHRPQDLWHMVTPDYQSTAIWVQLKSGDNQDMSLVMDAMDQYLSENPLPAGVTARWAGKTFINVIWQRTMVAGMLKSLAGAFVVVFLMMAVLFRSVRFGLLAMLPLTATILVVHGLIGWTGKYYDMPVAVLSSLTLGLSVDFAIHFIQRMRSLHAQTGSFVVAARQICEAPSRAIARNAIVIALGFTPLFLAPLLPYVTVGVFMASIMAISGVATLVLLPAVRSLISAALFRDSTDSTEAME